MEVKFSKQSIKYLAKLPEKSRHLIVDKIMQLPSGNTTPLHIKNAYRLRVGGFRVLFDMSKNYIFIGKIKPRGDVYK